MSQNVFHTGASSVELDDPPWSVKNHIWIYVKLEGSDISLYTDPDCAGEAEKPLKLNVYRDQATGLYFKIADSSDEAHFPNPDNGNLPVTWESNPPGTVATCPATVRYGKVKSDFQAFSMSDTHTHHNKESYGFNVVVEPGTGGAPISTALFEDIDPTIVEKGEDPPPDP